MRLIRIYIIAALVSLGTLLSGQAFQVEYITTGYHHRTDRFERFFNRLAERSELVDGNGYGEPVVCMSFVVSEYNIVYEEELAVEDWMASPFDWVLQEEELAVESWMTRPFELEGDIEIEPWMTGPF